MPHSEAKLMDCMNYMAGFPDKFFDVAIVDPPYGINAPNLRMGTTAKNDSVATTLKKGRLNSGGGHMKNSKLVNMDLDWDFATPGPEYFVELFRVSKQAIIWGGNYYVLTPSRGWIVWDKMQPWENFSQFEMAWTSFDMPAKMFRYSNTGGANDHNKIHPTQKPIQLYRYCYALKQLQGIKTALDTHLGSGTNRRAAWEYGIDFYSCDTNESYLIDQEKAFQLHSSQSRLFV